MAMCRGPISCRFCNPCLFPFAARFSHNLDAIMGRSACPVNGWPAPFAAPPCGRLAAPVWPFPFGDRALHPARPFDARVMRNRDAEEEEQTMQNSERQDIYTRITGQIVASLEQGVRPWMKPWSGENAAGRITRPLRHNGTPYSGINILMLWASRRSNTASLRRVG